MSCDIFNEQKTIKRWINSETILDTEMDAKAENYKTILGRYPDSIAVDRWTEPDGIYFQRPEEGTKHDDGKARYELFPWELMDGIVAVYTHGSKKYGDNNWRKGFAWGRIIGAVFRHFVAWWKGKDIDDDSGLHNLDQAVWGLLVLRYMQKESKGVDDRWK